MVADKIKQRLLGLLGLGIILLAFVPVIFEEPPTYLEVVPTRVPAAPVVPAPEPLFASMLQSRDTLAARVAEERRGYAQQLFESGFRKEALPASESGAAVDELVAASPEQLLVPLAFLADRANRIAPKVSPNLSVERQNTANQVTQNHADQDEGQDQAGVAATTAVAQGHALSRAWVLVLQRSEEWATLSDIRQELMKQRISSYIAPVLSVASQVVEMESRTGSVLESPEGTLEGAIREGQASGQERQESRTYELLVGPFLRREDAQKHMLSLRDRYPESLLSLRPYFPGVDVAIGSMVAAGSMDELQPKTIQLVQELDPATKKLVAEAAQAVTVTEVEAAEQAIESVQRPVSGAETSDQDASEPTITGSDSGNGG